MKKIVIIDTGTSNILSLKRAIMSFDQNVIVADDQKTILSANKLFLLFSILQPRFFQCTHEPVSNLVHTNQ